MEQSNRSSYPPCRVHAKPPHAWLRVHAALSHSGLFCLLPTHINLHVTSVAFLTPLPITYKMGSITAERNRWAELLEAETEKNDFVAVL